MGYSYFFINKEDLISQIRTDCVETVSDDNLITSTEVTRRVLLKFLGRKPSSIGAAVVYTHAEILIEIARPEWIRGV